jgi:SAM-dependent methyltransferase
MSRKYMNERWCVRCNKTEPTPYLKSNIKHLPFALDGYVLDIGCGNGRNSKYMEKLCYHVTSIDMADDHGERRILGRDPFPRGNYNIFLANYILMFLKPEERLKVMKDIDRRAKFLRNVLMIEMYPAKDAYPYDFDEIFNFFIDRGWRKIRKSKDKCLLEKYTKDKKQRKVRYEKEKD